MATNSLYTVAKGALPKANDINQLVGAANGTVDLGTWQLAQPITAPATALTATASSLSGNLNGSYGYVLTFVTGTIDDTGQLHETGETTPSPVSSSISVTNGQANLSNLPIGPATCVARRIYRNQASGSASSGPFYLVTTILNNTQTGYQDNMADSSLGAQAPTNNTTGSQFMAPALQPSGIGSATKPTRYVGGTVSGPPTSGVFQVGDFVIDQSGKRWTCVQAGKPGSWVPGFSKRYTLFFSS